MILAGGNGSRLGSDKARLVFAGQPILHRQVQILRDLGFEEILVAVGRPRSLPLPTGVVAVEDRYPGLGPLAGIHAGLLAARAQACLVVACDMPFLIPALLRELLDLERTAVKVCVRQGFIEPFPGVYPKAILPALERNLRRGELSVQKFIRSVAHIFVPEEKTARLDPEARSFMNINTWEALSCVLSE